MTILDHLLDELRVARGPIRSTDLARRIGVSESALTGMIDVLADKGILDSPPGPGNGETVACSGIACGSTCVGLDECPFVVDVPATYSLVVDRTLPTPSRKHASE